MTSHILRRAALATLLGVALGACHDDGAGGGSFDDQAQRDSGRTGAGSAHGTAIGQTPGYGGPGYSRPGAGGAAGDTVAGKGPLPPSGGVSSPNAAAAQRQADTAGGGAAKQPATKQPATPPRP